MSAGPEHRDVPVVNLVGVSDSGKTGMMEILIRALTDRGWRVASVKHHHQGELDAPGKDSWRHARAGAVATALVGQTQYAVFKQVGKEPCEEDVIDALGDADIVLVEGFKGTSNVKIEVVREARSGAPVNDPSTLFALVTDVAALSDLGVPVFGLDEGDRLAVAIEQAFLLAT